MTSTADIAKLAADPKTPPATRDAILRQLHGPSAKPEAAKPPPVKIPRGMNSWEKRYAGRLDMLQRAGEVLWYAFEPITIRLATRSSYKCDFLVVWSDGRISVEEIKGHERANDVTRWKVAAERLPWITFRMLTLEDGEWKVTRLVEATLQLAAAGSQAERLLEE